MLALTISNEKKEQILRVASTMGEKQKRQYLAGEALLLGYGGISLINRITGMSINAIRRGIEELQQGDIYECNGPERAEGAGRPKLTDREIGILEAIEEIVSGATYGTPSKVLIWTTLSLRKISGILESNYSIKASHVTVGKALELLGYSRQCNKKMEQVGKPAPDRNEQFEYINAKAQEFINAGEPVISVDTKKKENLGNFKNPGTEYRKQKDPRIVLDHDFPIRELGKVIPYGVYVLNENTGFINLGTDHDTAEFSVESIFKWWDTIGRNTFPNATKIFITCDSGGSNSVRGRLWKQQLAEFSKVTGLEVHVSHFPSGASKWNKIEHRMFCYISKNWQGKPLVDIETVISLISSTTTETGLKIVCTPDYNKYELGKTVSDEEFFALPIQYLNELGKRNYVVKVPAE